MEVLINVKTKMLSTVTAGELIHIKRAHLNCFCILAQSDNTELMLCLNNPYVDRYGAPQTSSFYTLRPKADIPVRSFGQNWVAVPDAANETDIDSNFNIDHHSGSLLIDENGAFITLMPFEANGFLESMQFNTDTWVAGDNTRELTIPFQNWDIWVTEDDYENYPDTPLVKIRA